MDRKEFLKICGMTCLGGLGISTLLQSCNTHYYAHSELSGKYVKVKRTEFTIDKNNQPVNRNYVLVRAEQLNFPIFLYKISDTEYSAVWMQCTHQGAELSAHGDQLICTAHGSEFDKTGKVLQGPAELNLRKFNTSTDIEYIYIQLS
jgi:Rieske Fe-S protein